MSTVADLPPKNTSIEPSTKTCKVCGLDWPIGHFRRNRKSRMGDCRRCHAKRHRAYRLAKQQKRVADWVQIVNSRDRAKVLRTTAKLCDLIGPSRIADCFWASYNDCKQAGRHATAAKLLIALADLLVLSAELNKERLAELTEAELEAALNAIRNTA